MKKGKQILAIAGIVLLIGLYVLTFLAALFDHTSTMKYLAASIFATVVIPVLIWAYQLIYRLMKDKHDANLPSTEDTSEHKEDE